MNYFHKFYCLHYILILRTLELPLTKCETIITKFKRLNEVTNGRQQTYYDKYNSKSLDQPNANDVNIMVERITRLESLVLDQQMTLDKYQGEVKEQIKVLRNATLLLLSLVSGKGSECQGLKDTSTKVRILHSALASFEPFVHFHFPEEISENPPFEETSEDYHITEEHGLESDDLVLESVTAVFSPTPNFTQAEISTTITTTSTTTTTTATTTGPNLGTTETPFVPMRCPRGSDAVGRECFSLHLIEPLNWTSSRAFCRNLGGDLAEPDLHNNKLPKQLLRTWPALRKSRYWTFWVGATDQEREGEWHWVTGGPLDLKEPSRWDLGEPPEVGESQDCLAMILWVPGRWQRWELLDDPCDLEWLAFCEYSKVG